MKPLYFIAVSAIALALPHMAFAQTSAVEIDPGLYDYTDSVSVNGQPRHVKDYEYCVREGRNSKTLEQIMANFTEGGTCSLSNVVLTQSTGSANISCVDPEYGQRMDGRLEAEHGTTYYRITSNARMNSGHNIVSKVTATRRGDCPAGWNNPDGVSED